MLSQVSFDGSGTPQFIATTNMNYPADPIIAIFRSGQPPVTAILNGDSSGYSATITGSLSAEHTVMFTALDSVGVEFPLLQKLSFHGVDSVLQEIVDGPSGVRIALDGSSALTNNLAILSSSFPPPRAGLPDSLVQLSPVIAVNTHPLSVSLGGRITITYSTQFDSITSVSQENAIIYKWSNEWLPLLTNLDTAHNTASAMMQGAGFYAVYLSPIPMGIRGGDGGSLVPDEYKLDQNYPNPFNPLTVIRYSLPERSHVNLSVFDVLGRKVMVLVDEEKQMGSYEVNFNATNLSGGVYYYRLTAGKYSETKKLLLLR